MSFFREIYGSSQLQSDTDYREVQRMLSEAMDAGRVEKVPVRKRSRVFPNEQWFRDKESGEIYCLIKPAERIRGRWAKVDFDFYS